MQEIHRRTGGAVELGPGTLYRSIRQLLDGGLIAEVEPHAQADPEGGRQRRSYLLTSDGKARTLEETQRLRELVRWAEEAMVLVGGEP
jgi:DNA-binding PadR family transcriptional regulator